MTTSPVPVQRPAQHRGRTHISSHITGIALVAIYAASVLAAIAVIAGYAKAWVLITIIVMLLVGVVAAWTGHFIRASRDYSARVDALFQDLDR